MAGIRERMPSLDMVVWLTAVWVLLWGDISWGNVVNGIILAVLVSTVLPLPRVTGLGSYRPLAIGVLVGRFLVDLVHGAIDVSRVALRRTPPRSAVIRVQLRSHSDIVLVTTAGLTSLIPGSVVIEAHRFTGVLYLHILDLPRGDTEDAIARVRRSVLAQEERLLRALSSDAVLADAGYRPGWRVGSGEIDATSAEVRP